MYSPNLLSARTSQPIAEDDVDEAIEGAGDGGGGALEEDVTNDDPDEPMVTVTLSHPLAGSTTEGESDMMSDIDLESSDADD